VVKQRAAGARVEHQAAMLLRPADIQRFRLATGRPAGAAPAPWGANNVPSRRPATILRSASDSPASAMTTAQPAWVATWAA
jgi:hypothetical protein